MYLAIAAYCEANNFPGAAKWMRMQAREEQEHALKIYEYVFDRGEWVKSQAIAQPPAEHKNLLVIFEQASAHEQKVAGMINSLYAAAAKENDFAMMSMLKWFVDEQVEEERNASRAVEMLKVAGNHIPAAMMLDARLGTRAESSSPPFPCTRTTPAARRRPPVWVHDIVASTCPRLGRRAAPSSQ
jgi:ferritin